jgi:hypothetical protein
VLPQAEGEFNDVGEECGTLQSFNPLPLDL